MKQESEEAEPKGKLMKKVLDILADRSKQSLKIAQVEILSENLKAKEIVDAARYYCENWKDFVHPGLISLACEAVGGNADETVLTQVSLLLLTAAADIHDDIIDGSRTKCEKRTLYGKFGKDIALLLGDAFWLRAFTTLHRAEKGWTVEKSHMIWKTVKNLYLELGDAEALEISLRKKAKIRPEEYLQMLKMKAANFEAQARIGAILGNGKPNEIEALTQFGRNFGILAFIREDFIDVFEFDELRNRFRNECLPLPILYALRNPHAKKKIFRYLSEISDSNVEEITEIVFSQKNVKELLEYMHRLAKETILSISALEDSDAKNQIALLIQAELEDL